MGSGSGQWSVENRAPVRNDSVVSEYVPETGCLSIIVLGASGDLAKKKTFPALFHLYRQGFIQSQDVHIFGYARTKISDDDLRARISGYLTPCKGCERTHDEDVTQFLQLIKYVSGAYDTEEGFRSLDKAISEYELSKNSTEGSSRRLFYLALPPSVYPSVCKMIKSYCMNKSDLGGWTRIVVEKPFGRDLDSAEELSAQIGELFDEPQIYRIDHYLGKELVQNLIVFREDFGTDGRGGYFDQYGEVVLGQYEGYTDDPTVPDNSNTPTFATMVLRIHNERWEGKALNSRKAEIRVQFKDVPGDIYKCKKQGRNEFVIRLQPSEAMYMKLTVKQPGLEMTTVQSELDLSYGQRIRGDQQHFVRRDELKAAWQIFTPLLHKIDRGEVKSLPYKPGSRGPTQADQLAEKAGYVQTHGYIWIPPTL
ncbi:glucose-6-phosphate dehydrogenase [Cynara cardunculus var. scolymus]|uniref:glucose-6-phosphate dehydrogenase (NADP(+)) n=1 Tax=Cynara cardunculus var. scolymus TaxID=59895 RepID=A0A118K1E1_CYNCS|nr:glucose-6-phosphate dehydrogenase [Cynara cardunculus var. scolymus]